MIEIFRKKKGIVLIIALATMFIVILLANTILALISSQSRLTHHQVSRIRAYYAAMAGVNFALENLRTGTWAFLPFNSCPDNNPPVCTVADPAIISGPIQSVGIIFCPSGNTCNGAVNPCTPPSASINFCVNTTVTYLNP